MKRREKNAILIVAFGTANKQGYNNCIKVIEDKIQKKYIETTKIAFTSNIIRKAILKKENIKINSYEEEIELLKNENYNKIFVLSLYVINGKEYTKLKNLEKNNIFVSKPLIFDETDYLEIVKNKEFNDKKNCEAIVFMGHGTDLEKADKCYEKLQKKYIEKGNENIFVATMDGKTKIFDVIEKLKKSGIKKVLLKPFLLTTGKHVLEDMASDNENSWKKILENNGFDVIIDLKGMGEYEFIQNMFLRRLEEIIEKSNSK